MRSCEELLDYLRNRGMTVSFAESCTGGLIGATITEIPGASEAFLGSAVTYSNDAKEVVLGVSHETLLRHGAVSAETAAEMAEGAIRVFGSSVSAAVTGIAGPGGAVPGKPVGLVWIAVAQGPRTVACRNVFKGDRSEIRMQTVDTACKLLLELMEGRL